MKFAVRACMVAALGALFASALCAAIPQSKAPAPARQTSGIDLLVVDASGSPLTKAKVTITDAGGETLANGLSDRSGKFSVAQVPPGAYRLTVGLSGLVPHAETLIVQEHFVTELAVRLTMEPELHGDSSFDVLVKDESGAVVPNTRIIVSSHAVGHATNGATFEGRTNGAGKYHASNLAREKYALTAVQPGFKTVKAFIDLGSRDHQEITITLPVAPYYQGPTDGPPLLVEPLISIIEPELIPEPPPTAPPISSTLKPQAKSAQHGPLRRFLSTPGHKLGF